MTFPVAHFRSAWSREPAHHVLDYPQLVRVLTTFRAVPGDDKRRCPAWSPTRYQPGTTRGAANVLEVSCLVLDYDDGTPPIAARKPWMQWPHIYHSSWSSTPFHPKYRIVVPLERPVPVQLWARAWHWAVGRAAPSPPDVMCKDPSRLYFLPAKRSEHDFAGIHETYSAHLLAIDNPPPTPEEERHMELAKRRPVKLRAGASDRAKSELLKVDPDARRRVAEHLGGQVLGEGHRERARGVRCPSCGRDSLWWPIVPQHTPKAMCSHRNSCGGSWWLDELLGSAGAC